MYELVGQRAESLGKTRTTPDTLSLEQMAALVLRNNFQTRTDGETQQREEGIIEPDAVHIEVAGPPNQPSRYFVTGKKRLQNQGLDFCGRLALLRCPSPPASWIWRYVVANEPTAEPTEIHVLHLDGLPSLQRA
jgi:hypothetical protein